MVKNPEQPLRLSRQPCNPAGCGSFPRMSAKYTTRPVHLNVAGFFHATATLILELQRTLEIHRRSFMCKNSTIIHSISRCATLSILLRSAQIFETYVQKNGVVKQLFSEVFVILTISPTLLESSRLILLGLCICIAHRSHHGCS